MAQNSILGINYTPPKYCLIEVSSKDVPDNNRIGEIVRVPTRSISSRELTNDQIRRLVDGKYVMRAPSGVEKMLIVDLLKPE